MKQKHPIILTFITLLLFSFSCNKEDDNSINTYRIDFKNSAPTADFIDKVELIELETNDSSLIKSIRKIEYYKDYIYIYDSEQQIVVIFDKNGKHIHTINDKGQGPKEYLNINDFGINRFSDQLYALDGIKQLLFYYDLIGNLVDIKKLPTLLGGTYISLQLPNKDTFMFLTADSNNRLKIMNRADDSFILEAFPNKEYDERPYLFSDSLFLPDLSNQVYNYHEGGIEEHYQIDIASLSPELKNKVFPETHNMESQIAFMKKLINSENIDYVIKQIDETGQFILLSFVRKSTYYTYIIEKETGSFYSFNTIDKDYLANIKYMNNDFLIGVYEPDYDYMYESIINPNDMNKLNSKSEESNPILMKYYLKK